MTKKKLRDRIYLSKSSSRPQSAIPTVDIINVIPVSFALAVAILEGPSKANSDQRRVINEEGPSKAKFEQQKE